jgi:mevalonate kinase
MNAGMRCETSPQHKAKEAQERFSLCIPSWKLEVEENEDTPLAQAFRVILGSFSRSHPCRLLLTAEIPSRAGLGSSAATVVAIIHALLQWYGLTWSLEQINELALQAECAFHGTPSGIDNTVAVYGGLCYLCDTSRFRFPIPDCRSISLKKVGVALLPPLPKAVSLVIINTRRERETRVLVAGVRQLLTKDKNFYEEILQKIGKLATPGYDCLQQGKYKKFGELLNLNHQYLQALGVSCHELDLATRCALEAGAMGAKLTGAGGGGCLIAFGPGREQEIMDSCQRKGFEAFVTTIG